MVHLENIIFFVIKTKKFRRIGYGHNQIYELN